MSFFGKLFGTTPRATHDDPLDAALAAARSRYVQFFLEALARLDGMPHATEVCVAASGDDSVLGRRVVDALIRQEDGEFQAIEFCITEVPKGAPVAAQVRDTVFNVHPFVWSSLGLRFRASGEAPN
jgi:hypothetical protein